MVFIYEIKLNNFKSFKNENVKFKFPDSKNKDLGLNIFVGENNSGKSTLIEAINFLFEGTKKDISIIRNKSSISSEKLSVEITFSGNLTNLIDNFCQENKKNVFKKYIFKENDIEFLIAKREEDDIKSIYLYNKIMNEYKNESGIDAPFKKLFEFEIISADKVPDEEIKFSSTSTIKKLLNLVTSDFEEKDEYKQYKETYEKTFNSKDSPLRKEINQIETNVAEILKKQFGDLSIKLNFENFDKEAFFKNSKLKVKDSFSNEEIDFGEKGEGCQRAISLSLIQIYSDYLKKRPDNNNLIKPFFLFIDEPELSLHPEAQKKLLNALKQICINSQIFISTHSPYFLSPDLFKYVYKFQNSLGGGTKIFYDRDNKLKDVRENRKFMFHHRDILFKDKVLFVEGVEDLQRYSNYFLKSDQSFCVPYIYMLGGKGDFGTEIKTFCEVFNIKCLCIKDLDHLCECIKRQSDLEQRRDEETQKEWFRRIHSRINFLDKELIDQKNNELKSDILVNPYVDVKDFISEDGKISEDKFEFVNELLNFFRTENDTTKK